MRFFFYGTLIDPDVRACVIGPDAETWRISDAVLRDWRTVRVAGRPYPAIVPRRGATTAGILADGAADHVLPRLLAYEGAEYVLKSVEVGIAEEGDGGIPGIVEAYVFAASAACDVSPAGWSFAAWQRRHRKTTIAALRARRPV